MHLIKAFCLFVALTAFCGMAAQAEWSWARSGGGAVDMDVGYAVAVDNAGNSYFTGLFRYTATFGSTTLASTGNSTDIFVCKLDPQGNWLWAKKAGGSGEDYGRGIAVDNLGNCYITGQFSLTASFGTYSVTSYGDIDAFVAALDTSGNWLWANKAGSTGNDVAYGISALNGPEGSRCYLTGSFSGTATFGTNVLISAGGNDLFVARLDRGSDWTWAIRGGGADNDCGYGIDTDVAGHSFVTGYFNSNATFGIWSLTSSGGTDALVGMVDNAGTWVWVRNASSTGNDQGRAVATDGAGNSYVTGFYYGTATFGATMLTSVSGLDIFIAKLDMAGNWLWARSGGGSTFDYGYGIAADSSGNVYATGEYWAPFTLGPFTLTGIGGRDFYAVKLDTNGNWLWALEGGSTGNDSCAGIAADNNGNCYLAGSFRGTCIFGDVNIVSSGNTDAFIARIAPQMGGGIPQAPQNLILSIDGDDILLDWDDVILNTDLEPITVDHYLISYRQNDADGIFSLYGSDGSITGSEWTHSGAAVLSRGFYYVTAVVED